MLTQPTTLAIAVVPIASRIASLNALETSEKNRFSQPDSPNPSPIKREPEAQERVHSWSNRREDIEELASAIDVIQVQQTQPKPNSEPEPQPEAEPEPQPNRAPIASISGTNSTNGRDFIKSILLRLPKTGNSPNAGRGILGLGLDLLTSGAAPSYFERFGNSLRQRQQLKAAEVVDRGTGRRFKALCTGKLVEIRYCDRTQHWFDCKLTRLGRAVVRGGLGIKTPKQLPPRGEITSGKLELRPGQQVTKDWQQRESGRSRRLQ